MKLLVIFFAVCFSTRGHGGSPGRGGNRGEHNGEANGNHEGIRGSNNPSRPGRPNRPRPNSIPNEDPTFDHRATTVHNDEVNETVSPSATWDYETLEPNRDNGMNQGRAPDEELDGTQLLSTHPALQTEEEEDFMNDGATHSHLTPTQAMTDESEFTTDQPSRTRPESARSEIDSPRAQQYMAMQNDESKSDGNNNEDLHIVAIVLGSIASVMCVASLLAIWCFQLDNPKFDLDFPVKELQLDEEIGTPESDTDMQLEVIFEDEGAGEVV